MTKWYSQVPDGLWVVHLASPNYTNPCGYIDWPKHIADIDEETK